MDRGTGKVRSPEEAALRRYYKDILEQISDPADLAESLYSEGIISDDTRDSVRKDASHAGHAILAAVQRKLAQSAERKEVMSKFYSALKSSCVNYWSLIGLIEHFIGGEYTYISVKALQDSFTPFNSLSYFITRCKGKAVVQ